MSAFLCNDGHITAIAAFVCRKEIAGYGPDDVETVGKILHQENVRSVNYRYKKTGEEVFQVDQKAAVASLSAIQILKAIDCLEYQSCEHPEWEKSRASRLLQCARVDAICMLPGYDNAAWELKF